jgi:ubiquinone/menaquinone biosynthesis C-methylase UbiE
MELHPDYAALDVACGTGVVTIPLAQRIRRVTALDISPLMLERLREDLTATGLANVTVINKDWNETIIGKDVTEHDIVLVSRSLPHVRLSESLHKLNRAAKRAVYITWRATRKDEREDAINTALGKNPRLYPDYLTIIRMLGALGIPARVEIFNTQNEERFPSLAEAVHNMARGADLTEQQYSGLLEIARDRLTPVDGFYCSQGTTRWALISWRKKDVPATDA